MELVICQEYSRISYLAKLGITTFGLLLFIVRWMIMVWQYGIKQCSYFPSWRTWTNSQKLSVIFRVSWSIIPQLNTCNACENPDDYIWRDELWFGIFSSSAWEPKSGQYYLHFSVSSSLISNWENENCAREFTRWLFWIIKEGIGGFRMDVVTWWENSWWEEVVSQSMYSYLKGRWTKPPLKQRSLDSRRDLGATP